MERFIILSALVLAAYAGPIQQFTVDTTCSKACTASDKFNYVPGKTYQFQYDTEVRTSVQGSSEDHAGVHMSTTVHMEVLTKCELVMRLTDVSLEEYDPLEVIMKPQKSSTFSEALEKYPLRISFQDGNVEELCLVAEEPQWVMNVKRGILSVFQNNFVDGQENSALTETDISGNCHTEYTTGEDGWYSKTIKKTKDLLSCTERNGFKTAIQGIPYSADSNIQSLPIVKSSHECEHQVDKQSHHLTSAICREQHIFRPFSRGDSGAITHSTQKLKLLQQTLGTRTTDPVMKKASLKFEHAGNIDTEEKTRKELEIKLMQICEVTKAGVTSETPRLFSDLVYIIRSVEASLLQHTYERIQDGSICSENKERVSKFLLDALPIAGTTASLHMMTDLLTRKVVTGLEASMWLTSLSFIKNPTKDMLTEVKPLISMTDNEEKALLSVGSLIHSYCTSSGGCDHDTVVEGLITAIVNKVARGCKVRNENSKTTLLALRAIGNAGFAYGAIPTLKACMSSSNPAEIRLSAIEAFRRMPCDADQQLQIMSVFVDTNEDSEIRIAAYKALMECPSEAVINRIKKTLEIEEVNQVGSYVWSHLTNLMETSDRHKQYVRNILEDEELKKEFDLDKRKFSRNYEGSFFIEKLNTGAKVEGDLIWSQKSFVPRSAMFNLTVDLFGHSVNLLELGGRAEGLEYFMESFFGPNGYFSENVADEPVKLPKNKLLHPNKMRKADQRFTRKMDNLRAAMYMRVFGNELRYMNFNGLESLLSGPNFNVLEMLIQMSKNNDYSLTHSTMFLDSSMIIPTGSGFPMNLTVNGTATVDLRLKGKMDLRSPPNVDIEGLIQPSAAIDISSMMSVDAYVTKSGIKMISTMHTNTAILGKLKASGDGVVTAEYEMPEPRMDIVSVKSSFFTIHNDLEKEQKMITENQQRQILCSSDKLVTVTGLEICAELQYPNASLKSNAPYFPLTGPVTAGVYLYNRDTHTKYKMEAKSLHTAKSNIIRFFFDTPESKIDRNIAVDINLNKKAKTLDIVLTSPWKKADFQGSLTNEQFLKGIIGKMNLGDGQGYAINALLKKQRVGNAHKFSPSLEITLPNREPYALSGMFMYNGYRQFDAEFKMDKVTQKPIKATATVFNRPNLQGVKGNLIFGDNQEYSVDISNTKKLDKKKVSFKPLISLRSPTQELCAFGGTVQYIYGKKMDYNLVLDKIVEKKITLKGFLQKLVRKRNRVLYRNKVNFGSSPMDLALDAKLDNRNFRTVATDIDFTYVIRRIARNNIKLVSKINNFSSRSLIKGRSGLTFSVKRNPELNLKMIGNVNHNAKHTEADLDIRYGSVDLKDENKHVEFALESNRNIEDFYDVSMDGQMKFKHVGQDINMVIKGNHKHERTDLGTSVFMKFGKQEPIESTLRLRDKTSELLDVSGVFTLSYPGKHIVVNETIRQPEQNKYVNSFSGQLRQGQKNSIVTSFTRKGSTGGRLDAEVSLYKETPYHLDAELSMEPTELFMQASYQKDSKTYSGSYTSVALHDLSRLVTDIQIPERRIKLSIEGRPESNIWSADLKWNADKNEAERVTVTGWLDPIQSNKINGSLSLYYPERTLTLNAYTVVGAKYTSHADFTWEKDKTIDLDFIYGSVNREGTEKFVSQAQLKTPFQKVKHVSVDLTHADEAEEYRTDIDLRWMSSSVATTTIIRKPISFRTIVGSFQAQTSFKQVRKLKLDINHKLSDSLASVAKLTLNKRFVQTEVVLINQTKYDKLSLKADINIKSSFPWMKRGKISLLHSNDGINFETNGDFLRNRKKYGFTSIVTREPNYSGFATTGSVILICPYGNSQTRWSHKNSWANIDTVFSTTWGLGRKANKEIKLKLNGNHDIQEYSGTIDGSIELLTPFTSLRDIQVLFQHEHKNMDWRRTSNYLKTSFNVLKDKRTTAAINALFDPNGRNFNSHITAVIPDLDIDSRFVITAADNGAVDKATFIRFEVVITPSVSMSLLLKAMFDDSLQSAVEFRSSFPGCRNITYIYNAWVDKFMGQHQLAIVRQLHYNERQLIEIATKLVLGGRQKRGFISIKSLYRSLQKFEGNIQYDGKATYESYIEMLPYFNRISASVVWNTTEDLSARFNLETPFRHLSDLDVNVYYKNNDHLMHTKVGLDYNSNSLLQVDVTNDQNKMKGSVAVSLPSGQDINGYFSHSGSVTNFVSHAEVLYNRKNQFIYDLSFSTEDHRQLSLTGGASLKGEILPDDGYEIEFHHEGWHRNFKSHAEFSTSKLGKSEVDVSFDMRNDIDGSFTLKSPLMKNIISTFNLHTSANYFQARVDHKYGGRKIIDFLATVDTKDSFLGELSLSNPFTEDAKVTIRANGILESFTIHTEGNYGQYKSDIDLSSSYGPYYLQQTLSIKATGMHDITGEISYNGFSDSVRAHAQVNIGRKQQRIEISLSYSKDIEGVFSLSSPFIEPVSMNFNFRGMRTNFRSHAELVIGSDISEVDFSFSVNPGIKSSFTLKTPYWTDLSTEFDHSGNFPNILTHAEIGYDGKKQFSITTTLSAESKLSGSLLVETPLEALENLQLAMSHEGGLQNFRCHGEIILNGDKTEGDIFYNSVGRYEGLASIKSHLFRGLSVGFEHSGTQSNFKSHAEYTFGLAKTEGDISVDFEDETDIRIRVRSPDQEDIQATYNHKGTIEDFSCHAKYASEFSTGEMTLYFKNGNNPVLDLKVSAQDISLNLHHVGKPDSFNTHGEVTYEGQTRAADISLIIGEAINGSITVTAPLFSLKINKIGNLETFVSNVEMVKDYDRYAYEGRLETKNGIVASIDINTPFDGYEKIKTLYTHDGMINNFKCHAEFSMPGSVSIGDLNLNLDNAFEGSFSLSSPLIPDIIANFEHSRTRTHYQSQAELSVDHDAIAGLTISLDQSSGLDGAINIMTPFRDYGNIRLSGTYLRKERGFSLHQEVLIGSDRHEVDISYESKSKHIGSLSIRTPLLPEIGADFDYLGKLSKFDASGKLLVDGVKKFSVTGSLNTEEGLNLDFNIITPLENFSRITGQLLKIGDMRNLNFDAQLSIAGGDPIRGKLTHVKKFKRSISHAEFELDSENKYELDSSVDWRSSSKATLTLKTPLTGYEEVSLTLNHDGHFPNVKSSAKFLYPQNEISFLSHLNHADSTTGKLTLALPFKGFEHIDVSFFCEGSLPHLKAGGKLSYATGKEIDISVQHDQVGTLELFKFHLMSPFTNEINLSFNHTGVPSNFINNFELAMGQENKINIKNILKTGPGYISYLYTYNARLSGISFTDKISFNYEGNLQKFKTDALVTVNGHFAKMETSFQLEPIIDGSLSLQSSLEALKDIKISLSHTGNQNGFVSVGELQYSQNEKLGGKVDITNHGWRRMVVDIELRTPYEGYTMNKIMYEHTGDSDSFQCNGKINVDEKQITGTISGSKSPLSLTVTIHTPFKDYERLAVNANVDVDRRGRYSSRMEVSWNPSKSVVFDGSLATFKGNHFIEGSISLSSPFEYLRQVSMDITHRKLSDKYIESVKASYDGKSLVDLELDYNLMDNHQTALLTVRAPRSMKFELDGELSLYYTSINLNTNWNMDDPISNLLIIAGYDFRPVMSEKTINFKLSHASRVVSYSGSFAGTHSKSDFAWGSRSDQMVGYDIAYDMNDAKAKLVLPSRSLEVLASRNGRVTEGSVMWDADKDQTKKIGFRSVVVPSFDSVRADLTLMLPSLGKNVQVDSEMVVNRGRIFFDAKTELSYSPDDRKKIVVMTKLEDISSGSSSKNYSFSLGLSHPFSTVGIKMDSHVGKSENELTGSLGLEYLNAQRQTKVFHISGQVDKLRKTVLFELLSPVKTITISGTAQTNDKFKISLLNSYDHRQPLHTVFSVDPEKRIISFMMNYDIDNPSNEFHISTGYINSSAVAGEISHVTSGVKVTDALIAMRLNNSHLLHSRLHWRPQMMEELEIYFERKSLINKQRLEESIEAVLIEIDKDVEHKLPLIFESIEEIIGEEAVVKLDKVISPALVSLLEGINGVTNDVSRALAEQVKYLANKTGAAYQDLNIAENIPAMNQIDSSSISKIVNLPRLVVQPLVKSTSYAVGMLHDQVKRIPSQVSEALKYRVGNMLPNTISQQMSNANHYWEWEDNMNQLMESFLLWVEPEVLADVKKLEYYLLNSVTSPITVYDPAHGEIQADFHLPITLKSLDTLPEFDLRLARYVQNIIGLLPQMRPLNFNWPDFRGELLPPFNAHASIQNGHKITTFDGFDYDLPLDCTFVLAKDFMDGNFSLILSNDGGTSLTVLAKGRQINLKLSGEVSVDGVSTDLPYKHKNLTVTTPEDGLLMVDGAGSFKVSWDTADDYIVVTVSGWYYGKTGGLLGVYDNEPSNDLMTPFKKVIDSTSRFAATWDIGKTACR